MRRAISAVLALLLAPMAARAQAPTVIVVNFGPGAANDVAARLLAAEFQAETGTPFVVKNTTGAAGTIGAQEVVRARSDGLTLLLSPIGPVTIQPSYMRNAGYRTADLAPICQVTDAALVIQTPKNSGLRTMDDLIARARAGGAEPLYVVAIGAITNIASALLAAPDIAERIVVVWLGGQPISWHHTREFNLSQDLLAARALFDSGVALVRVPCLNVAEHLRTTQAEMERFVKGQGAIGDYLFEIYSGYYDQHYARSKEIWDIGPIAWLVEPAWVETTLVHSPILTAEQTWSHDSQRHLIRDARVIHRDPIFADLFRKLERSHMTDSG